MIRAAQVNAMLAMQPTSQGRLVQNGLRRRRVDFAIFDLRNGAFECPKDETERPLQKPKESLKPTRLRDCAARITLHQSLFFGGQRVS